MATRETTDGSKLDNCERCKSEAVLKWKCIECGHKLCLNCKEFHSKIRILQTHQIINLEDSEPNKLEVKAGEERFPKETNCDRCRSSKNVKWKCSNCNHLLCYHCKKFHDKMRRYQDHEIIPLDDNGLEKMKDNETGIKYCDDHPNEPIKTFCKDCNCQVCLKCVTGDHNTHSMVTMSDIKEKQKELMDSIKSMKQKELTELEKEIKSMRLKQKFNDTYLSEIKKKWEKGKKKDGKLKALIDTATREQESIQKNQDILTAKLTKFQSAIKSGETKRFSRNFNELNDALSDIQKVLLLKSNDSTIKQESSFQVMPGSRFQNVTKQESDGHLTQSNFSDSTNTKLSSVTLISTKSTDDIQQTTSTEVQPMTVPQPKKIIDLDTMNTTTQEDTTSQQTLDTSLPEKLQNYRQNTGTGIPKNLSNTSRIPAYKYSHMKVAEPLVENKDREVRNEYTKLDARPLGSLSEDVKLEGNQTDETSATGIPKYMPNIQETSQKINQDVKDDLRNKSKKKMVQFSSVSPQISNSNDVEKDIHKQSFPPRLADNLPEYYSGNRKQPEEIQPLTAQQDYELQSTSTYPRPSPFKGSSAKKITQKQDDNRQQQENKSDQEMLRTNLTYFQPPPFKYSPKQEKEHAEDHTKLKAEDKTNTDTLSNGSNFQNTSVLQDSTTQKITKPADKMGQHTDDEPPEYSSQSTNKTGTGIYKAQIKSTFLYPSPFRRSSEQDKTKSSTETSQDRRQSLPTISPLLKSSLQKTLPTSNKNQQDVQLTKETSDTILLTPSMTKQSATPKIGHQPIKEDIILPTDSSSVSSSYGQRPYTDGMNRTNIHEYDGYTKTLNTTEVPKSTVPSTERAPDEFSPKSEYKPLKLQPQEAEDKQKETTTPIQPSRTNRVNYADRIKSATNILHKSRATKSYGLPPTAKLVQPEKSITNFDDDNDHEDKTYDIPEDTYSKKYMKPTESTVQLKQNWRKTNDNLSKIPRFSRSSLKETNTDDLSENMTDLVDSKNTEDTNMTKTFGQEGSVPLLPEETIQSSPDRDPAYSDGIFRAYHRSINQDEISPSTADGTLSNTNRLFRASPRSKVRAEKIVSTAVSSRAKTERILKDELTSDKSTVKGQSSVYEKETPIDTNQFVSTDNQHNKDGNNTTTAWSETQSNNSFSPTYKQHNYSKPVESYSKIPDRIEINNSSNTAYGSDFLSIKKFPSMNTQHVQQEEYENQENLEYQAVSKSVSVPDIKIKVISTFQHEENAKRISAANRDEAWIVYGYNYLQLISKTGYEKKKAKLGFNVHCMTLTKSGNLLLGSYSKIYMLKEEALVELADVGTYIVQGMCVAADNDDILACLWAYDMGKVIRLSVNGQLMQTIEYNKHNVRLFISPEYITCSPDGDIWVTDTNIERKSVVVTTKSGSLKFRYKGPEDFKLTKPFSPKDLVSTSQGQVLITDYFNRTIHMVSKDGQFLKFLLNNDEGLQQPHSLSKIDNEMYWVASESGYQNNQTYLIIQCII